MSINLYSYWLITGSHSLYLNKRCKKKKEKCHDVFVYSFSFSSHFSSYLLATGKRMSYCRLLEKLRNVIYYIHVIRVPKKYSRTWNQLMYCVAGPLQDSWTKDERKTCLWSGTILAYGPCLAGKSIWKYVIGKDIGKEPKKQFTQSSSTHLSL